MLAIRSYDLGVNVKGSSSDSNVRGQFVVQILIGIDDTFLVLPTMLKGS